MFNEALASPAVTGARLTAVASGKGGVGKTWFSITLAHAWARLGRRVLLFDGDLGLANIDIQLGLPPAQSLAATLAGRLTLAEAAQHHAALGFDVLAGQSGSGVLADVPSAIVDTIVTGLRTLPYDDIVLDLGAGLDHATRSMAAQAHRLLVLVTDEPTSLTDAYAVIKLNAADAPGADVRVVVNQAANAAAGQRTYDTLARACTHFLNRTPPLAGIVRRDDRVRDTIRRQTPLFTRHPNCHAAADMERVAAGLTAPGPRNFSSP